MPPPARATWPEPEGLSETLRRFTAEYPHERGSILAFVAEVARTTAPGATVLDLGAGNAPYRELFHNVRYLTSDWSESPHEGAQRADIVASADARPVADGSYDLVLCTQVLEHVPEPAAVVAECHRVLATGGRLAVTVPLLWELHELPHDYYRYTAPGLAYMLEQGGFDRLEVRPRGDGFTAIAQLMRNLSWTMGDAPDGLTVQRIEARELLEELSEELVRLAPLDVGEGMPLGYTALAHKL